MTEREPIIKINNDTLSLFEVLEPKIPHVSSLQISAGCISLGPLEYFLMNMRHQARLTVITGTIAPNLQRELDLFFNGDADANFRMVGQALKTNTLLLGFHPEMHMGIWLLRWPNPEHFCAIWGSSTVTWNGLKDRRGEQNEISYEWQRFALEDRLWRNFADKSWWVNSQSWPLIKPRCWNMIFTPDPDEAV